MAEFKSLLHFYHGLNTPFCLRFDITITNFTKLIKANVIEIL